MRMKQLTGLDATFLYMETPTTYGHVNGLSIYRRPSDDFDPYAVVRAKFESMIGDLAPLRRRLVEVPLGLDHPWWIDDPHFDLDYHVRHMSLAPPGRDDQLADQVCRIVARPMDRSRPLWEIYVIEGLAGDRWATLFKGHHATIDGANGVIVMGLMNDTDPDAPPPGPGTPWEGEPIPHDWELLNLALKHLASNPVKAVRTQMRIARELADTAGITGVGPALEQGRSVIKRLASPRDDGRSRLSLPSATAPATPWNRTISRHRRFAMRSSPLDDIKALKTAVGGTVNDVVMAICAGALREYLLRHDALPDRPLRAMVPVSIRTGQEADPWTNRVSALFVDLPTDVDDPLERVARCSAAMQRAKRFHDMVPASSLVDLTQNSSPILAASAMRLASQVRLADRVSSPVNVVISNVPGPRQPLYFGGAQLEHYIPVSTITDAVGLNITVHSYLDRLDFGLIACRELVPDLWDMVDLHVAEIDRLFAATGAERPTPPEPPEPPTKRPAATKKATAKKATAKKAAARKKAPAKKKAAARKKAPAKKKAAAKKTAAARKRSPSTR
jgi:diacylglycerol O-acyltransferase / wax synthase